MSKMFEIPFDFNPTPEGAYTTEGWVKHDLESGGTDTYWLDNAASDAVMDADDLKVTPYEYLACLLLNVQVPTEVKLEAALRSLARLVQENQS